MKPDTYHKAILWLEQSEYDVKGTLRGSTVRLDLLHNGLIIKSETVLFSTSFVEVVQKKIITLYEHFNKPK